MSTRRTEIERKFVVLADRVPSLAQLTPALLEQGYVAIEPGKGAEVRIRDEAGYKTLTVKTGSGLVRAESEVPVDDTQFTALWTLTDGRRIRKLRYRIQLGGGQLVELDVYEDALAGLVIAEVEFGSAAEAEQFVPPSWFGEDVTDRPEFKNKELARSAADPGPCRRPELRADRLLIRLRRGGPTCGAA